MNERGVSHSASASWIHYKHICTVNLESDAYPELASVF